MKKLLLVLSLSLPFIGYAQTEGSVFTATGRGAVATTFVRHYQSLGINAGNLNIQGKNEKIVGFALFEVGASAWSDALEKKELRQAMFRTSDELTKKEKQDAAVAFVNRGVAFDLDVMTLGVGVNLPKVGGFAFSTRERISSFVRLDEFASNLLFEGFNYDAYFDSTFLDVANPVDTMGLAAAILSGDTAKAAMLLQNAILTGTSSIAKSFGELMNNTRITFTWTREYSFGYGREIYAWNDVSLYGGVGIKFIQGFGIMDLDLTGSKPGGYLSVSPVVPIDFSDIETESKVEDDRDFPFPKPVGKGFGFEFGFTSVIVKKYTVGLSMTDIGKMKWDGNVLTFDPSNILDSISSGGFESFNVIAEAPKLAGSSGMFNYGGIKDTTISLPTKMRIGAHGNFGPWISTGFDLIIPMNKAAGNIRRPVLALGADLKPVKYLTIQTGFTFGGNYNLNWPGGIQFNLGPYAFGAATRDLLVYIGKNKPTISTAFGFLRFQI